MATRLVHCAVLLSGFLGQQLLLAAESNEQQLPDDPEAAWAEVEGMQRGLRAPDGWQAQPPGPEQVTEFQEQVRKHALSFAEKAREFAGRFPTNENAPDARVYVIYALSHAVAAGDTTAEQQITDYVAAVLADKSLPEDNRVV